MERRKILGERKMILLLMLIPVFAIATALLVYRLNGKREIFRLDIIQFFYAFILAPILFIWSKTLLYTLMRSELNLTISSTQLFIYDTIFSTFFLFIFAFIVIHSVTKSINLKVGRDPLYDIFQHSEYFHLWLTHIVMYLGGTTLITVLAMFNVYFPLDIAMPKPIFYFVNGLGALSGLFLFLGVWLSDPKQQDANFLRMMKLSFGILFLIHAIAYFTLNVSFDSQYIFYWWSSFLFATVVFCSLFAHRSQKAQTVFDRISNWFKHQQWDVRVQLFKEKIEKEYSKKRR